MSVILHPQEPLIQSTPDQLSVASNPEYEVITFEDLQKIRNFSTQTALSGDKCDDLEPFEKAVERFRKQLEISRMSSSDSEKAEELNEQLFEKVKKILGKKMVAEFQE